MPTQQPLEPNKPVKPLNEPMNAPRTPERKEEVERKFSPEGDERENEEVRRDEKGESEFEKGNETQLPTPNRKQDTPKA